MYGLAGEPITGELTRRSSRALVTAAATSSTRVEDCWDLAGELTAECMGVGMCTGSGLCLRLPEAGVLGDDALPAFLLPDEVPEGLWNTFALMCSNSSSSRSSAAVEDWVED